MRHTLLSTRAKSSEKQVHIVLYYFCLRLVGAGIQAGGGNWNNPRRLFGTPQVAFFTPGDERVRSKGNGTDRETIRRRAKGAVARHNPTGSWIRSTETRSTQVHSTTCMLTDSKGARNGKLLFRTVKMSAIESICQLFRSCCCK